MARAKRHSAEQIVNLLRQIEVGVVNGKTRSDAGYGHGSPGSVAVLHSALNPLRDFFDPDLEEPRGWNVSQRNRC